MESTGPSTPTENQLLEIMDEYGDSLTPVNDARWWEAAVSEIDGIDFGEDEDDEDVAEDEEGGFTSS